HHAQHRHHVNTEHVHDDRDASGRSEHDQHDDHGERTMSGRDRIILVVVVSLVLVVGSWVAVIQPKRDQASKLGTQISTAQTTLNTARGQVIAGEAAKSSYAQDYAQIARLGEAVPSDDNVPSLIYQLQNAASSTGVDFRVLKLNPAASSGPVTTPTTTAAGASTSQASTATLPPG